MRPQSSAAKYILDPEGKPVEDRMVSFSSEPSEEQLAMAIGYPLMGTSSTTLKKREGNWEVFPQMIPVRIVAIWLYFVLVCMIIVVLFTGMGKEVVGISIGAGILIVPMMLGLFSWLNSQTGSEPYLVYDPESATISLPRLKISFPREQVDRLVSLNRFVDGNRFYQIAILVRQEDHWLYAHVCNEAGTASWGSKSLTATTAEALGVPFVELRFNRRESQLLKE